MPRSTSTPSAVTRARSSCEGGARYAPPQPGWIRWVLPRHVDRAERRDPNPSIDVPKVARKAHGRGSPTWAGAKADFRGVHVRMPARAHPPDLRGRRLRRAGRGMQARIDRSAGGAGAAHRLNPPGHPPPAPHATRQPSATATRHRHRAAAQRHSGSPLPPHLRTGYLYPALRRRGRGDRRCLGRFAERGTGGKSELHRAGCWPTASRGDSQESATENKPPPGASAKGGKGETVR